MAKTTFISLGPAALEILRAERRLNARERANTPEAKEKAKRQHLIRQGAYFYDEDYGIEFLEDYDGTLYEMTKEDKEYRAKKEQERSELVANMYEKTLMYLADYTPVDTGNLFDSIYTDCQEDHFIIGFDVHKAPYAVYQHEDTTLHHVNGTAKFLQQAVLEASMVADSKHKLSVNITIKGLHEGAKLEVQVGLLEHGNLDSLLTAAGKEESFKEEAKAEFNHDYWSDINTTADIMTAFNETDLIDINALNEYMSNRRMHSKTLGKVSEKDLQSILNKSLTAGSSAEATAALSALLMKRRINHRKAMAKLNLASTMGWGGEES